MSLNQRILSIRKHYKLSQEEFANLIGITRQGFGNIEKGKNDASYSVLEQIVKNFPLISVRWLILGEGEMLEDLAVVNDKQAPYGKDHKDALIEVLQRERELLNRELKRLRKMIPGEEDS